MTDTKTLQSAHSFQDTITQLQSALEAKGFVIFAIIDQQKAARAVGLDMPPTTLLIYGNPRGGIRIQFPEQCRPLARGRVR